MASIRYPSTIGLIMVPLEDATRNMDAILPSTGNRLASVHVNNVGNTTESANPDRKEHTHTPISNLDSAEKYSPVKANINRVQYIVMIRTGLQNLTRNIPANLPLPNAAQYTDVANDPIALVQSNCRTQKAVRKPAKVSSMAL